MPLHTKSAICKTFFSQVPFTHLEKKPDIKKNRRKVIFGKISWEKMLTNPKFVKKITQFIKLLKSINQFRYAVIT